MVKRRREKEQSLNIGVWAFSYKLTLQAALEPRVEYASLNTTDSFSYLDFQILNESVFDVFRDQCRRLGA